VQSINNRISNAWKAISVVERIKKNNQNDLLIYQFIYQATSSLAVFTAVAAFLWTKEVDNVCIAPYYKIQPSELVHVEVRFRDILKIWWTYALIDFFRSIVGIIATNTKSICLARLYQAFFFNDLLGIAAVIMVHAYRF
jgi:hypothetical protein